MSETQLGGWQERLVEQKTEVKLLLDENLPRSLKAHLRDEFPTVVHVADQDLLSTADSGIWDFARAFGFAIVTKDKDFADRVRREGPPPPVVQIQAGNCPTWRLTGLLQEAAQQITIHVQFGGGLLELGGMAAAAITPAEG